MPRQCAAVARQSRHFHPARNGERQVFHQDPYTYTPSPTNSTALCVTDLLLLGAQLAVTYLTLGVESFIQGISPTIVNTQQVQIMRKTGGEEEVMATSASALSQGLFPPLGGLLQNIPVQLNPLLESWTNCPAFDKHVTDFYGSDVFKAKANDSVSFLQNIKNYVEGENTTLENIWNIYDTMNTGFTYNPAYALALPPTSLEQARDLANFHEDGVFSGSQPTDIGNIAGSTLLDPILNSLQRMANNADPLKLMVLLTSYPSFISFLHQTEIIQQNPELKAIPNFGAAFAIELRRGGPPDTRDFLRFKFRNGTADPEGRQVLHAFGHHADIPLTEFIYRVENSVITSNKQWAQVCGVSSGVTRRMAPTTEHFKSQFPFASLLFLVGLGLAYLVIRAKRTRATGCIGLEKDAEIAQAGEL
ncbi:histidine phosphatase superfamily [Mycena polygramma]|nr:histidine phosphatase superfamily [Mycena polygramma]